MRDARVSFSGQSLEVIVTLNEGKFHMWKPISQTRTGNYRLAATNVKLHVLQFKPSSDYRTHLQSRLEKEHALYLFPRTPVAQ
jgi:hypothetical protein